MKIRRGSINFIIMPMDCHVWVIGIKTIEKIRREEIRACVANKITMIRGSRVVTTYGEKERGRCSNENMADIPKHRKPILM